jgi:hypothetical protein
VQARMLTPGAVAIAPVRTARAIFATVEALTDLSQFADIPQAKSMKLGESWPKVFTTAQAGWRAHSQ